MQELAVEVELVLLVKRVLLSLLVTAETGVLVYSGLTATTTPEVAVAVLAIKAQETPVLEGQEVEETLVRLLTRMVKTVQLILAVAAGV
jgi:hypothetical protein